VREARFGSLRVERCAKCLGESGWDGAYGLVIGWERGMGKSLLVRYSL
jgi:hypothetical protein